MNRATEWEVLGPMTVDAAFFTSGNALSTLHGIGLAHFGREYLDDAHILAEDVDIVADRAVD